ncbi:MAG: hypothetical protein ACOX6D_06325, partial [Thermoguttaceae bacterium]
MSIFNVFGRAQKGLGRSPKKNLDYRRFKLESLEDRYLLSVNPGFVDATPTQTAAEVDVETCVGITTAIPTVTQVDVVDSITEAAVGDTIYVSVYVKSTNPAYGITGGYCSLNFDSTAF